jgi:hypothetical protein
MEQEHLNNFVERQLIDMAPTCDLYCSLRQPISGEEAEKIKYSLSTTN